METYDALRADLERAYPIAVADAALVRDWIGCVYDVRTSDGRRLAVKLYRVGHERAALQAACAAARLLECGLPVPGVLRTRNGELSARVCSRQTVVSMWIEGSALERGERLPEMGALKRAMEHAMKDDPMLTPRGKPWMIDRYTAQLKRRGYAHADAFFDLGDELWGRVCDLPPEFSHGDYHAGNMIAARDGLTLLDFDACGLCSPLYDAATVSDATDYFGVSPKQMQQDIALTMERLDAYMTGYRPGKPATKAERSAVLSFVAVRHFDIQATIIDALGDTCVDDAFLDRQLLWIRTAMKMI